MNSIPELCGYYIALLRTAYNVHQNSHWRTSGSNFYGNHLLFQRLYESAGKDADGAAEKMIGVFGDETLNLSIQAQLIGKMMAKYSGSSPLENSMAVEKAILAFSDKLYEALGEADKLSLGTDNFLQGVADKREEAVYLLKQTMSGGSKTASRKDVLKKIADEKLKELKDRQKKKIEDLEAELAVFVADEDEYHAKEVRKEIEEAKSLARLVHKKAAQQGDPTQILHQRLLTWLTATIISYVQGQYNDGDITVDVDLQNKRIFGNIRAPKAIKPDLQTKIENDFRTQVKQLLGDATGFTIGVGFAFFPKHASTKHHYRAVDWWETISAKNKLPPAPEHVLDARWIARNDDWYIETKAGWYWLRSGAWVKAPNGPPY